MSVGNWIFIVQVKNIVEILRTLHCLGMSGSDYPVTYHILEEWNSKLEYFVVTTFIFVFSFLTSLFNNVVLSLQKFIDHVFTYVVQLGYTVHYSFLLK